MQISEDAWAAETRWSLEHGDAARREGWSVFSCHGSRYGAWQICHIDEPDGDDGCLYDDGDAWNLVVNGKDAHHETARAFMRTHEPAEWQSICHNAEVTTELDAALLAEVVAAKLVPDPYTT